MAKHGNKRWRHNRNTVVANRRRRRTHRRDVRRGGYTPVDAKSDIALVGVRRRLALALMSTFVTVVAVFGFFAITGSIGALGFLALGLSGLATTVALLQSALREENLHRIAGPPTPKRIIDDGADGCV